MLKLEGFRHFLQLTTHDPRFASEFSRLCISEAQGGVRFGLPSTSFNRRW